MPRLSKIRILPADQKEKLKAIIREHAYCQLDLIRAAAKESGITLSKSVLHRFVQSLYKAECGAVKGATIVVIVNREGQVISMGCDAPASEVEARIRALERPEGEGQTG